MPRKEVKLLIDLNQKEEQEFEFTARCDMCGMEHEFKAITEVSDEGKAFLNITVEHHTAMLYGGYST